MCLCVFILISLATLPSFASETDSGVFDCGSNQWRCKNGYCITIDKRCNGVSDCSDDSDEASPYCRKRATAQSGACILPPYPEHGTYEVEDIPNAQPGQSHASFVLRVRCRRGFGVVDLHGDGSGVKQVYCINGKWYPNMPKCVRFCKLDPDPSIRYMCYTPGTGFIVCNNYVSPGTIVDPVCNSPIYYSTEVFQNMRCISGVWNYYAQCKAECGRITPGGKPLLIGGKEVKRGELPWHAAIYRKMAETFMQICGGSIVSNNVVISAAHCFWKDLPKLIPATEFAVAVGKLHRPWDSEEDVDAQKSHVKEIRIEKLFAGSSANFQEDIAVLILTTPFNYTTFIRPVCLDFNLNFESLQLQHGVLGKVAGWGLTAANGRPSETLKFLDLPFISVDNCTSTLPMSFREYITGDKFCAGYTNGTAVCQGDSGGGLAFPSRELGIDRYYLRGIVSTAPNDNDKTCNDRAYTTFTKITKHQKLIIDALAETTKRICPLYAFQCDDGSCVDPGSDCNGRQDCADGSDESDELCRFGAPAVNINTENCGRMAEGNVDPMILENGYSYSKGHIPWLAAIYRSKDSALDFLCGGTLISNRHVVSVAHAFRLNNMAALVNSLVVQFGSYNRNDWSGDLASFLLVSRKLFSITVIDSFNNSTLANDLSILTLDRQVELNMFIRPACLWSGDMNPRFGLFAGWGEIRQKDGKLGDIHILSLSVVSTAVCRASNKVFEYITSDKTLCARNLNGTNPCVGDSGGGLYSIEGGKWSLRGVLSLALRPGPGDDLCNLKDYVVFTDVSKYLPWIKNVLSQNP